MTAESSEHFHSFPSHRPSIQRNSVVTDYSGQNAPPGAQTAHEAITNYFWEDQGTLLFAVQVGAHSIARRQDNNMVNGTALLDAAGVVPLIRDSILNSLHAMHVVRQAAHSETEMSSKKHLHEIRSNDLVGVWVSIESAIALANLYSVTDDLWPLFVHDLECLIQMDSSESDGEDETASDDDCALQLERIEQQNEAGQRSLQHQAEKTHAYTIPIHRMSGSVLHVTVEADPDWDQSEFAERWSEGAAGNAAKINEISRVEYELQLLLLDACVQARKDCPTDPPGSTPGQAQQEIQDAYSAKLLLRAVDKLNSDRKRRRLLSRHGNNSSERIPVGSELTHRPRMQ